MKVDPVGNREVTSRYPVGTQYDKCQTISPTHLSLFSGIGCIDIAAEMAGFKTIGQVEIADYPYRVLCKHWPNVKKWRDIKNVTAEEVINTIGKPALITGGFPCQDTSYAGLRAGIAGERSGLVFEQLRLLRDLQPDWAVFENVPGFRTNGLKEVLGEIAKIGYDAEWYSLRASGFGAPHRRERIFIVAHPERDQQPSQEPCRGKVGRMGRLVKPVPWDQPVQCALREFRGVDDGTAYGVDRTDSIRNAVVPQEIFPIFAAIAEEINRREQR